MEKNLEIKQKKQVNDKNEWLREIISLWMKLKNECETNLRVQNISSYMRGEWNLKQ